VLTRGDLVTPLGQLDQVWSSQWRTTATRRGKLTLQTICLHASQDKQMDTKPRSAKSRICYTYRKKGHLARIVRMVTLCNPTLSIMIFINLGMTWLALVLWGWLVHLKLVQGLFGFLSILWLTL
jgi:hypothetical protein